MLKVRIYLIHLVSEGLMDEYEPVLTADKEVAFQRFKEYAAQCGFRDSSPRESFTAYRKAFFDFEWRYRMEYESISDEEKSKHIASEKDWNPDDNQIYYRDKMVSVQSSKSVTKKKSKT